MNSDKCLKCGAYNSEAACPFCEATSYDFTTIDDEKPTYIRIKWHNTIMTLRVLLRSIDLTSAQEAIPTLADLIERQTLPTISMDLVVVPD